MLNPDQCQAKAEKILRRTSKARKRMAGKMVNSTMALQLQLAAQADYAEAQVWATLATRRKNRA